MSKLVQRSVLTGLVALLASTWASAGVTVLSKPQLGTFTTIQAAIDAASDNDVLLVDAGTYVGFTIDNKALSVVATGAVTVNGTSKVIDLGPNRSVALIGMTLLAPSYQYGNIHGLVLDNDTGNVRVQGCTMKGSLWHSGYGPAIGGHGALVTSCARVIFTQCVFRGRDIGAWGGEDPAVGGDGLNATDSSIALYDCSLKGGEGSYETAPSGGDGGAGCRVTNYGVFASGSTFTGGRGESGDYFGCTTGGNGGAGLVLEGAQAQLLDDVTTGGLTSPVACILGLDGQPIVSNGGVVNVLAGTRRKMTAPAVCTDNATLPIVVTGQPGDVAWLLFGKKPAFLFVPGLNGVLGIPSPWYASKRQLGVIGPTGVLNVGLPIGDLQGAVEGWLWTVQGWVQGAHEQFLTGPLRILVRNT